MSNGARMYQYLPQENRVDRKPGAAGGRAVGGALPRRPGQPDPRFQRQLRPEAGAARPGRSGSSRSSHRPSTTGSRSPPTARRCSIQALDRRREAGQPVDVHASRISRKTRDWPIKPSSSLFREERRSPMPDRSSAERGRLRHWRCARLPRGRPCAAACATTHARFAPANGPNRPRTTTARSSNTPRRCGRIPTITTRGWRSIAPGCAPSQEHAFRGAAASRPPSATRRRSSSTSSPSELNPTDAQVEAALARHAPETARRRTRCRAAARPS